MNIKIIRVVALILIILLSYFNIHPLASEITNKKLYEINNSNKNYNGYIIEFVEDSLLKFKNLLRNKINEFVIKFTEKAKDIFLRVQIQNYKQKLISIQKNAKTEILNLLGHKNLDIFSSEFTDIFNGISIKEIPDEIIEKIKDLPYVKDVVQNTKISIKLDDSIPLINADETWKLKDNYNRNLTGRGVTIAFLDTGVNYSHPDLKDNYITEGSYDFVNNDSDPMDDNGHGTHVTGIACGSGILSNFRYVGVSPDAKFYSMKILDESGVGSLETYLAGMQKALDPNNDGNTSDHADIICLSLGTDNPGNPHDKFCEIVDELVTEGIVVVIAAGNNGPNAQTITSPGCAIKGICVGSVNKYDQISYSSSRGPVYDDKCIIQKPDLVAPGVNIFSCSWKGGYRYDQGTSMATPHVAGAAALLLQANPEYTPEDVKCVLKQNAKNLHLDIKTQGAGRIDILNPFLDENIIITKAPTEIVEGNFLRLSLTNKKNNPINAWILITIPLHLPRLKYGSDVWFIAPLIFSKNIEFLEGKIYIFKIFGNYKCVKKDIKILNK